jgi:ribosomal protein S18 acetylase RimI-like enzyme
MNLRRAIPDDATALAHVHVDSWRAAYRGLVPDEFLDSLDYCQRSLRFRESLATGSGETYLAEKDGEPFGILTVGACRDADLDRVTAGEIWGIYLAPQHWRKGLGRALFQRAEQMLQARGYTLATLWVLEGNQQARRFYEAMGFETDGASRVLNLGAPLKAIRYRKYWQVAASSYQARQAAYLESEIESGFSPFRDIVGVFNQIARLALGRGPLNQDAFRAAIKWINIRRDCADFALAGLLRILYRYLDSPLLTPQLRKEIEAAILDFCYWYDQPGVRGMCFHTENHQILFHSCELLAGQLFRDDTFRNDGRTGEWHSAHGAELARQWMDQRARFGFSEWLSNCYFEEDLLALLNLYDFSQDPDIRRQAGLLADTLLLEIALHQFRGVMATTHGRTYAPLILHERQASTTAIAWLVFGLGALHPRTNLALAALCTSDYVCPPILHTIAHDQREEITLRERHGLNVEDASAFGLHPDEIADNMFFWACQTARHPAVRPTALRVAQIADDPWLVDFVNGVDGPLAACRKLIEDAGGVFDGDAVNTALSEANLITFRTPDYQLSCAQDFRPGKPGYQQHIWQATLAPEAVVFTTHPGTDDESGEHTSRPNFWAGNRWLPRAAQHRNVAVCVHHVPPDDPRPYSHAYFPRDRFDQVMQQGNWVLAKKDAGYLALYSQQAARWIEQGLYAGVELRADAPDNIWICEMGNAAQYGSFENFVRAILAAPIRCDALRAVYTSPTVGEICFGWTGPLTVAGREIPLHGYPRFSNPYGETELNERRYVIRQGDKKAVIDFSV